MALATDYVFRPREAPAPEAGNRRAATPGNGEDFSELLSKARGSQAEPLGTGPYELALATAAPPPLPAGSSLAKLPEFSQDGVLFVSAASESALGVPATDIAGPFLPGIESAELAVGTRLVAAIQADASGSDPRSLKAGVETQAQDELPADRLAATQGDSKPADPRTVAEVARTITGDPDRIIPQTSADAVSQVEADRLENELPAGRQPAVQGGPEPADPRTLPEVIRTITGDPGRTIPQTPAEAVPQIAAPPLANLENPESVDAGTVPATDASKSFLLPTATASRADAGASAGLNVPEGEIAAAAAASRDGSANRTDRGADRPAESSTHSEPATLATAPTSAFGIVAAALDVQTVSQPVATTVPAVAATSPAISPRSIAKPDSGQVSDTPSSGPSLPNSDTSEFADVLGTSERLATSEAPGSTPQGAPALAAVTSAPAAIQSSSISVAVPPAMAPANAILVAAPADITSIVSNAVDNGDADRIVIQLDPPELGRVSIDFKFDANGLQHVTVTGESPEAMRQLRLMYFELTQALERHGITSQNMSFQQQQQNAQHSPTPNPFARQGILSEAGGGTALEPMIAHNNQTSPRMLPGGRLDMKL